MKGTVVTKNTLVAPLNTTKNVAVKLTKKYGVAVLATTAAVVIFSKLSDNEEENETNEDNGTTK
jgi:hypothetical protein